MLASNGVTKKVLRFSRDAKRGWTLIFLPPRRRFLIPTLYYPQDGAGEDVCWVGTLEETRP